jgi:hypothetical protein
MEATVKRKATVPFDASGEDGLEGEEGEIHSPEGAGAGPIRGVPGASCRHLRTGPNEQ